MNHYRVSGSFCPPCPYPIHKGERGWIPPPLPSPHRNQALEEEYKKAVYQKVPPSNYGTQKRRRVLGLSSSIVVLPTFSVKKRGNEFWWRKTEYYHTTSSGTRVFEEWPIRTPSFQIAQSSNLGGCKISRNFQAAFLGIKKTKLVPV